MVDSELVIELLRKYRDLSCGLLHFAKIGTTVVIAQKILKRTVKKEYQETISLEDEIRYRALTPVNQSFDKRIGVIYIQHPQFVNEIAHELDKIASIINLEHVMIVNTINQSFIKEVAGIEFNPYSYG